MKNIKNLLLTGIGAASLALTGCERNAEELQEQERVYDVSIGCALQFPVFNGEYVSLYYAGKPNGGVFSVNIERGNHDRTLFYSTSQERIMIYDQVFEVLKVEPEKIKLRDISDPPQNNNKQNKKWHP